jgi:hypothetical protein
VAPALEPRIFFQFCIRSLLGDFCSSPFCFHFARDLLLTPGSCKAYPPRHHAGRSDHHSSFCGHRADLRCAVAALRGRRTRDGRRRFWSWRFVLSARRSKHSFANDSNSRHSVFCDKPGADAACPGRTASSIHSEPDHSSWDTNSWYPRHSADLAFAAIADATRDESGRAYSGSSGHSCACGPNITERSSGTVTILSWLTIRMALLRLSQCAESIKIKNSLNVFCWKSA